MVKSAQVRIGDTVVAVVSDKSLGQQSQHDFCIHSLYVTVLTRMRESIANDRHIRFATDFCHSLYLSIQDVRRNGKKVACSGESIRTRKMIFASRGSVERVVWSGAFAQLP
jgi:hypothetical protein